MNFDYCIMKSKHDDTWAEPDPDWDLEWVTAIYSRAISSGHPAFPPLELPLSTFTLRLFARCYCEPFA